MRSFRKGRSFASGIYNKNARVAFILDKCSESVKKKIFDATKNRENSLAVVRLGTLVLMTHGELTVPVHAMT